MMNHQVMEKSVLLMEMFTKDSLLRDSNRVRDLFFGLMAPFMRGIGSKARLKVAESISKQMVGVTRENGKII